MVLVYAFVSEDATDLIDLVEPTNDEALEVKLGGYPQIKLLIRALWWVMNGRA